jgi:hypothetical protein
MLIMAIHILSLVMSIDVFYPFLIGLCVYFLWSFFFFFCDGDQNYSSVTLLRYDWHANAKSYACLMHKT